MNKTGKRESGDSTGDGTGDGTVTLPSKARQVVASRKVWAGGLGLVVTLTLWGLGEIDGARAVDAMTWVLGVFIGAVALEDGMTRFFGTLIDTPSKRNTGEK